tara:strand:- start:361 stop:948 length:588 start_codon:yes stop_codon:yes gene_type:complete
MDQYIFNKPKSLSKKECSTLIELLESSNCHDNPRGYYYMDGNIESNRFSFLKKSLLSGIYEYAEKHSYLKFKYNGYWKLVLDDDFMIKKILPGDFYGCKLTTKPHEAEHCEHGPEDYSCQRVLAWMFYLNTIIKDGGTHWPQQNFTSKPEVGDLYIWPAGWTHSHYGIPAPNENKYFVSGWCSVSLRTKEEIGRI